jgi:hypothetical protein
MVIFQSDHGRQRCSMRENRRLESQRRKNAVIRIWELADPCAVWTMWKESWESLDVGEGVERVQ